VHSSGSSTAREQDASDIAIGRLVGNRRAVPGHLFDAGDYSTTWQQSPVLFTSLTTHKLFRRSFLQQHGLRFSEGPVRLEDMIFVVDALLASSRVSVVGSEPCYVYERRDDGGNLTSTRADPVAHAQSARRIVDAIVDATEPGPQRTATLARTLRGELLGRVSGPGYLAQEEEFRVSMFREIRDVVVQAVDPSTDTALAPAARVLAALLRAGDRTRLEQWAAWQLTVTGHVTSACVRSDGTRLLIDVSLRLEREGAALVLRRKGDRLYLTGPSDGSLDDVLESDAGEVTSDVDAAGVGVALVSRDNREEWRVAAMVQPVTVEAGDGAVTASWDAVVEVDVATAASGRPLRPGVWDAVVRVSAFGWTAERRVVAPDFPSLSALTGADHLPVIAFAAAPGDALTLDVGQWARSLAAEIRPTTVRPLTGGRSGSTLRVELPLAVDGGPTSAELVLLRRGGHRTGPSGALRSSTASGEGRAQLEAAARQAGRGAVTALLRFGGPGSGPLQPLGITIVQPAAGWPSVGRRLTCASGLPTRGTSHIRQSFPVGAHTRCRGRANSLSSRPGADAVRRQVRPLRAQRK
jgi:hypothetical protein